MSQGEKSQGEMSQGEMSLGEKCGTINPFTQKSSLLEVEIFGFQNDSRVGNIDQNQER